MESEVSQPRSAHLCRITVDGSYFFFFKPGGLDLVKLTDFAKITHVVRGIAEVGIQTQGLGSDLDL